MSIPINNIIEMLLGSNRLYDPKLQTLSESGNDRLSEAKISMKRKK